MNRHTWTEALTIVTEHAGGDENRARLALGKLLDGDLELPQEDDAERVVTDRELGQALTYLREEA